MVDEVRRRIRDENQNFLSVFLGDTGSGKTWSALTLASGIDAMYIRHPDIVYGKEEFFDAVADVRRYKAIVWDEAGVGISSHEWATVMNKIVAFILQTFREEHNYAVIFTTPHMGFIDKKARELLHSVVEMMRPTDGDYGWGRWYNITHDHLTGKMYYLYPEIRNKEGRRVQLRFSKNLSGNIKFNPPPEKLIEIYREKKKVFQARLKEEAMSIGQSFGVPKLIDILLEDPRKYGLGMDMNDGDRRGVVYALLLKEYPSIGIKRRDVADAVSYVMNIEFLEVDKKLDERPEWITKRIGGV